MRITSRSVQTIEKTIMTARLFSGFWDRWIVHGLSRSTMMEAMKQINHLEDWLNYFEAKAITYNELAVSASGSTRGNALRNYYQASLCYNLCQWIFPSICDEKKYWYSKMSETSQLADQLLDNTLIYTEIKSGNQSSYGRIRRNSNTSKVMIILTPIDSTAEELFSYEDHFFRLGFSTVCFDGPGQGKTLLNGWKLSTGSYRLFLDELMKMVKSTFPGMSVYLFGTSSGALWAIEAAKYEVVKKVISVSPSISSDLKMPDYFNERVNAVTEDVKAVLPIVDKLTIHKPVLLFHGAKDVLVKQEDINRLISRLPQKSEWKIYPNEGHCCNYKLDEIRSISAEWCKEGVK
ncbi:Lysophospholipase, alpha-beta hydrolase superfamily [Gracilibacillus ureilyticus]|uniref:Lysophospholipase, alpha-beta hydrolase superfamily n=1 Tax=Gracilibacillus ureilyticus TaxID=531814 RepID=A0A1H9M4J2_9BACI|nr:alpha/beta hydrolase [Gracilibacillus ureilyticus]SER18618.1 Lysophospholipase, alpha-beta hydrolase superfamily [Gracilibacillus ureilyticus]